MHYTTHDDGGREIVRIKKGESSSNIFSYKIANCQWLPSTHQTSEVCTAYLIRDIFSNYIIVAAGDKGVCKSPPPPKTMF